MKVDEVKEIAKEHGIKAGKMNKTDLIKAIQNTEGNDPCFASGKASQCGQESCLWRQDCPK
ncbi:Rho termination factor N-terminal domain-containing protein [Geotalea sp. SG265]|uniref:Rho termination factor N-terminal domain-containing protein n=1 Tax=Geotalea sp. SG265 TaxID=2922867 RepID=UPI001FAF83EF|nr:Rho termination factor N-terminal domain-containing protein [Geotalea sp. SG265]